MSVKRLLSSYKIKALLMLFVAIYFVLYNNYLSTSNTYMSTSSLRWLDVWQNPSDRTQLDAYIEDEFVANRITKIAIGSGITSKKMGNVSESKIGEKFQMFSNFVPTFCETASPGFEYHFYLAFDATDELFKNPNFLAAFKKPFNNATSSLCSRLGNIVLHMVQCSHSGKPAWAQNDAMMEAYLDNMDYHYRVNDDTIMKTGNWTEGFIAALNSFIPPNVGVVGPNHTGGNTGLLTYDFVHRTHIDVFGLYYPLIFPSLYADSWITEVYLPNRSMKIENIHLVHTLSLGQRYNSSARYKLLQPPRIRADTMILNRYINYTHGKNLVNADGRRVISMSLFGKYPNHIWGAIRNAQMAPIFFPGWKLRIYVPRPKGIESSGIEDEWHVPRRVLKKLKQLGAEISYVNTTPIPPLFWRYLVIDDDSVDYFIVRNADNRLCERDAIVVNDWLQHHIRDRSKNVVHCIRDHPNHKKLAVVDGLWGGNRTAIRKALKKPIADLMNCLYDVQSISTNDSAKATSPSAINVLRHILWPLMSSSAYCHDSVSCNSWPNTHKFPVTRHSNEYLGQEFNQHQEPVSSDRTWLKATGNKCTNVVKPR